MRRSEIGADHFAVFHHFLSRSDGDELAVVKDRDPVGQRHDSAQHMLDKNDGRAALAYFAD